MAKSAVETIFHLWHWVKAKVYTKSLSLSFFSIGKKTTIIPPFRFNNLSQIQLGNGVTIHSNSWIQVIGGVEKAETPRLVIKDYTSIGMDATISAAKKIIIGEHVLLARNVYISDHEHEFHDITKAISQKAISKVAEVKIGANTWLGQNSAILPGVTIGRHCVIGANSVVTRDVPDYSVAVGSPARVIRTYDEKTGRWEPHHPDE